MKLTLSLKQYQYIYKYPRFLIKCLVQVESYMLKFSQQIIDSIPSYIKFIVKITKLCEVMYTGKTISNVYCFVALLLGKSASRHSIPNFPLHKTRDLCLYFAGASEPSKQP